MCIAADIGDATSRPALIIPVLDEARTPYLGGYNGYQIPQASGNSQATAGYYSIALQDAARTQPTVIATQVLTGCLPALLLFHACTHGTPGIAPTCKCIAGVYALNLSRRLLKSCRLDTAFIRLHQCDGVPTLYVSCGFNVHNHIGVFYTCSNGTKILTSEVHPLCVSCRKPTGHMALSNFNHTLAAAEV